MVKRKIIQIDEERCDGCGLCVPNCHEGALQIIDGKARLVNEIYCDGLGNCLGHCPKDAIKIVERDVGGFDFHKTNEHLKKLGKDELKHNPLGQNKMDVHIGEKKTDNHMEEKNMDNHMGNMMCGCPGSMMRDFSDRPAEDASADEGYAKEKRPSELRQWPVQLHLINPMAPYYEGKDVVLAADCTAFALGDFHKDILKGKSLAIACPKLDDGLESYAEKITALFDEAAINTLTVITMEVPCCSGLIQIAKDAAANASRKIPIKSIVVGIQGDIISERWI